MKKLPLGESTFKDIINNNKLYVDKTQDIYNLLNDNGKYFFLSRPRRFGKSLLITTLEEIFLGNQDLFKDLYIYNKIEWKKYPVIKLTMNNLVYSKDLKDFEESLVSQLSQIYKKYNLENKENNYILSFKSLIYELSKIDKVVVLIDEYDKPIIEYIEDIEKVKVMRNFIKNFYEIIKANDEYIKFAFLTGVSKFSKISIFSSLNNLTDLTLDPRFPTLLGITENEIYSYFEEHIISLADKLNITEVETKQRLKLWYNGYSWNGKDFVYNPYSILNVLTIQEINNYWFKSGTPTFLIKLIKEKEIDIKSLENFAASDALLDSFEVDNIKVESLLFQTGYLTIKEIKNSKSPYKKYILNYPNMEVEDSLLTNILIGYSSYRNDGIVIGDLIEKLEENDLKAFFDILKYKVFTEIPNEIFMSDKEKYYHTIIYLVLTLIGVRIKVEISTNIGRIDSVIETDDNIYLFEFKMNSVNQAMNQIEEKRYYEKYLLQSKPVYLVGVSFDSSIRNIKDWKSERMKKSK